MADPVVIVDYDPRWPAMFREEQEAILRAIGPHVVAVEHVGSTAVPGLGAKPIIDILVGIGSLNEASACIRPLEALGYRYVPEFEAEFPERRYFDKGRRAPATSTWSRSPANFGGGTSSSGTTSALVPTWPGIMID